MEYKYHLFKVIVHKISLNTCELSSRVKKNGNNGKILIKNSSLSKKII